MWLRDYDDDLDTTSAADVTGLLLSSAVPARHSGFCFHSLLFLLQP